MLILFRSVLQPNGIKGKEREYNGFDRAFESHILWYCGRDNRMAADQQYRAYDLGR